MAAILIWWNTAVASCKLAGQPLGSRAVVRSARQAGDIRVRSGVYDNVQSQVTHVANMQRYDPEAFSQCSRHDRAESIFTDRPSSSAGAGRLRNAAGSTPCVAPSIQFFCAIAR